MIEYIIEEKDQLYNVIKYYTPDNYKEKLKEIEELNKSLTVFKRASYPVCGGPLIATFYDKEEAEEFIKLKNK